MYIEFPDGLPVDDIELDSIRMNDSIIPETDSKYGYVKNPVSDYDNDGKMEFMAKFNKVSLIGVFAEGENKVTITGKTDSYRFIWSGKIEAKEPGKNKK